LASPTPAVFFVIGFVSGRDFVARCVLVLATLVGGGSLFFSPLVASGLVWVAGIPVGLLLGLPRSRFRAVDFFAGFGLLPVCDPRASLGLQSGLLPAARCRLLA